jgi:hypothetical protein
MDGGKSLMPITNSNFTVLNTTDFSVWLGGVNTLASGWLGPVILLVTWLAVLITLKANPWTRMSEAFAVASFVAWLTATLMLAFTFVSITIWAATLSLMILGGVWLWLEPGA